MKRGHKEKPEGAVPLPNTTTSWCHKPRMSLCQGSLRSAFPRELFPLFQQVSGVKKITEASKIMHVGKVSGATDFERAELFQISPGATGQPSIFYNCTASFSAMRLAQIMAASHFCNQRVQVQT